MTDDPDDPGPTVLTVPPGPDQCRPYGGFDADWWKNPRQLRCALARSLWWTFVPHDENTVTPKIVTTMLMFTWTVLTIGEAFGMAEVGPAYPYITVVVFAIVSVIWGFELGSLHKTAGELTGLTDRTDPDTDDEDEP